MCGTLATLADIAFFFLLLCLRTDEAMLGPLPGRTMLVVVTCVACSTGFSVIKPSSSRRCVIATPSMTGVE